MTRSIPMGARLLLTMAVALSACRALADGPDLILHHGKIVTVDGAFSIREALAITGEKITAVGTNGEVLKSGSPRTKFVDLHGKIVLPGLIDSHTHPRAAVTEFAHPIPEMTSIQDVLDYIKSRAAVVPPGKWIIVQQVFITRLREQRYPTRQELDSVAPNHPVLFSTGPDASVNSLALKLSGIDKNFKVPDNGPGKVELDPATGEPTGIIRKLLPYVKSEPSDKQPTEADYERRTIELFQAYNAVGLTTIADRDTQPEAAERYKRLLDRRQLTVRVAMSYHIDTLGSMETILQRIHAVAQHPLRRPNPMVRIIGIKTFLDGGMLTGSAYMRQPWGRSKIYSITDPKYQGLLFIPPERLVPMVRASVESDMQFTAHCVGDGALETLLSAYAEVNKSTPVAPTRPCVTHGNFMYPQAIGQMKQLGVVVDVQPIWLYLDVHTLVTQFGYDRLAYFQPFKSLFDAGVVIGGGSDHMQKIGSLRSINPYNPFLAMQTAITRVGRLYNRPLHPEQALSREQAIRMYTINNAHLLFKEQEVGSLEPGKFADLVVLDTDLLTCPIDRIRRTKVLSTYLNGKLVFTNE